MRAKPELVESLETRTNVAEFEFVQSKLFADAFEEHENDFFIGHQHLVSNDVEEFRVDEGGNQSRLGQVVEDLVVVRPFCFFVAFFWFPCLEERSFVSGVEHAFVI